MRLPAVCTALTAICKLISPDLINAVLPRTIELLTHPRELVRKKAVMALHRLALSCCAPFTVLTTHEAPCSQDMCTLLWHSSVLM